MTTFDERLSAARVQAALSAGQLRPRRKKGGEQVAKEGAEGGYGVAEQGGERVGAEVGKGELEEGEVFVLGQAGGVGQDGGEPLGEVIDGRVGKLAGFGAKLTRLMLLLLRETENG